MNDYKELRIEGETFDQLRSNVNVVLQRALGTMKDKMSAEGKVTIGIDIKMAREVIPNYDPAIPEETREILKPRFEHKVTSAISIKAEEKGTVNPEMAMVWDEEKQEYVLTYVNNTEQRSMFDTDFEEVMNGYEEETMANGMPLLEGEVAGPKALPGPIDNGYGYDDVI